MHARDAIVRTLVLYALAEHQGGGATTIAVEVDGPVFRVEDDGRGHAIGRTVGDRPYLPFIYEHLQLPFADGAAAPVQLHGLGLSLLNTLCESLELEVRKPQAVLRQRYRDGRRVDEVLTAEASAVTGNRLHGRVRADLAAAPPDGAALHDWLQRLAAAHPALRLRFQGIVLQGGVEG